MSESHSKPLRKIQASLWNRFTQEAASHIRLREMSASEYALLYGVCEHRIYCVWKGTAWRPITNP